MSAPVTVRLDPETIESLDRLAAQTERSRNWLVTKAVEEYLATNRWQVEMIEAGIREADAGDFASDEDVARVRNKFSSR